MASDVELVVDCRNQLGEGVLWNPDDGRVWWTDIEGRTLWSYDPVAGEAEHFDTPDRLCCFAPCHSGGIVAAFADGFAYYDVASGARTDIAAFEPDNPNNRLNDGRTDRQGRLVAGGVDEKTEAPVSTVVRLDPDGSVTTLIERVSCANGTCFSLDGRTMYFADTPTGVMVAYEYNPESNRLGARRVIATFEDQPGMPDGSCVDAEGYVWNAQWGGHRVVRYAPTGAIDRVVEVPVANPTCCAFGGPALDTLFITSAREDMSPQQLEAEPTAGSMFAIKPGVRGLADTSFAA